ncbi:MAG: tetratricopeptide repeat protein [Candidatus Acidiferrales bacterium]
MARIQRQELKHDEFADSVDSFLLYLEDNWRRLTVIALVVLLGGGSVGGYVWHSREQEQRAGAALTSALFTLQAPVQAGLPPLPGEGPEKIFNSEQAKFEAARKEFDAIRAEFPRTRSAQLAAFYVALCDHQLDKTDAAIATLEELSRVSDSNVAAQAQLTLAGFYQQRGRSADAEKLYRRLADNPTVIVPRSLALLELATLQADSDPAAARKLLDEIKREFPDTQVAAEVTRRMELLPAAPAAAQP